MSVFSGKCDFYDGFVAIRCDGDEEKVKEELKKLELFIYGSDGRTHRVKSESIKDIAKYYPYLESIACSSKDRMRVILSSDSFIDREEKEMLGYKLDDIYKYWRKCKRDKKEFTEEECLNSLWYTRTDEIEEIVHRVAMKGNKAEFDDIHFPLWEHFRREWFEELVNLGYTEQEAYDWCFKGFFDPEEIVIKRLGRPLKQEEENENEKLQKEDQ